VQPVDGACLAEFAMDILLCFGDPHAGAAAASLRAATHCQQLAILSSLVAAVHAGLLDTIHFDDVDKNASRPLHLALHVLKAQGKTRHVKVTIAHIPQQRNM